MRQSVTNLSKGELAPALHARIDIPQYAAGAKKLRNFIIQRYGGCTFRPGTRFVGEADSTTDFVRYIPFQFSIEQAYMLMFGNESMRPLANGGFILEDNLKIESVTQGSTTIFEVMFHNYSVGDRTYIDGQVGAVWLNGMFATIIAVLDQHHVRVAFDSTNRVAQTGSDGMTRSSAPSPSPPLPPPAPPSPPPPTPPDTGGGGGSGGGIGNTGPGTLPY